MRYRRTGDPRKRRSYFLPGRRSQTVENIREPIGAALTVTMLFLLLALSLSETVAADERSSCEAALTCARETKVVNPESSRGPILATWTLVSPKFRSDLLRATADHARRSFWDPVTGMKFVRVPGACYRTDGSLGPARDVCLDPFYIGVYEVTFDEYDRFARATDRALPDDEGWGRGRRPVINVNVYDALNFAKWLSRRADARYRLPTEIEWEHAARAGSTTRYPWGNELGKNRANCDGCGSGWDDERTAPVGSFAPNAWGLYDVAGNVGEWTCSMRDAEPSHSFERCDSIYQTRRRVYENGAWSDGPESIAVSWRDWNVAMRRSDDVGFRLVRECVACKVRMAQSSQRRMVR
jgi:formylglycine-generating enzyme required for sulfatase activity